MSLAKVIEVLGEGGAIEQAIENSVGEEPSFFDSTNLYFKS